MTSFLLLLCILFILRLLLKIYFLNNNFNLHLKLYFSLLYKANFGMIFTEFILILINIFQELKVVRVIYMMSYLQKSCPNLRDFYT